MTAVHRGFSGWSFVCVAALLSVAAPFVAGCGDGQRGRVHVSGQVLIDGKPLTVGTVGFVPTDARAAFGSIGADGRFTLTSFEPGDGVVPGTHRVSVSAVELLSKTTFRCHAPKKYADYRTSDLTQTISGPTDSLVIELTWNGGKPFIEVQENGENGENGR